MVIVENSPLLTQYIVDKLGSIDECEADPQVLAEFIVALLKHDVTRQELQALCVSELQDFLGKATDHFVKQLFRTMDTKSYIPTKAPAREPSPAKPSQHTQNDLSGSTPHHQTPLKVVPSIANHPANTTETAEPHNPRRRPREATDDEPKTKRRAVPSDSDNRPDLTYENQDQPIQTAPLENEPVYTDSLYPEGRMNGGNNQTDNHVGRGDRRNGRFRDRRVDYRDPAESGRVD